MADSRWACKGSELFLFGEFGVARLDFWVDVEDLIDEYYPELERTMPELYVELKYLSFTANSFMAKLKKITKQKMQHVVHSELKV